MNVATLPFYKKRGGVAIVLYTAHIPDNSSNPAEFCATSDAFLAVFWGRSADSCCAAQGRSQLNHSDLRKCHYRQRSATTVHNLHSALLQHGGKSCSLAVFMQRQAMTIRQNHAMPHINLNDVAVAYYILCMYMSTIACAGREVPTFAHMA